MQVLFLNHKVTNCGVYQYGLRLYSILQKCTDIVYIYVEIDSADEYNNILTIYKNIRSIIYNYHNSTMSWLNNTTIQHKVKNIGIPHESPKDLFDIVCNIDPNEYENNSSIFSIPRPIYENVENIIETSYEYKNTIDDFIIKYTDMEIPIFGSFGFGFDNKGFEKIISIVNQYYDNAIIKLVIPIAHFDPDLDRIYKIKTKCLNIPKKPGIELMISHEFFTNEQILKFLKTNTMNIFLYDMMSGRGISSAIDYALSVKKPIGISDSYMFRNIYSDYICLYKNSITTCINNAEEYIYKFVDIYSHKKMISKFKKIIEKSL